MTKIVVATANKAQFFLPKPWNLMAASLSGRYGVKHRNVRGVELQHLPSSIDGPLRVE